MTFLVPFDGSALSATALERATTCAAAASDSSADRPVAGDPRDDASVVRRAA